ncbi:MAG TPA: helix-turn-helix domain-containing protein [Deltaproteobacteria bacterium]|nr:helix-turn-helix domain-containing protein [Deltaproteobacteria bacterium]HOM29306.1 helix-turn-helix domain-containing protein [Deltaproteobacteria bacterium]HPP79494.1 helix-turn-helix domain-containing protein [Deltaproteobacteria bacterium]
MTESHRRAIQARRERERNARIQGILQAAKKVFFSKGYLKTTMDEIALEAQVSKPTIYQYFKTKDELYSALMLPFLEEFGAHFETISRRLERGRYASGSKLVKDLFRAFEKSFEACPDSLRVANTFFQNTDLIGELEESTRLAISSRGRYDFELARRLLAKAMERGLIREMSPYMLSDIIWGMMLGITQVMDMKAARGTKTSRLFKETLRAAERIVTEAIAIG